MPPDIEDILVKMCVATAPREMCGFINADWETIPITNVHKDPTHHFQMAEKELIAAFTHENLIGMYHSHPCGPPQPSEADRKYAPPKLRYWIVTPDGVYEWERE